MVNLQKKKRAILSIMFAVLLILTLAYSLVDSAIAESYSNDYDKINVMDDLNSSPQFDINKYQANSRGQIQIVNFVEYCYSYRSNLQSNYALYVYIFNPARINIQSNSARNLIQLGTVYNEKNVPTDYDKYQLMFLNCSEDNLFYKYKIIDKENTILKRVNADERRYDVSGIELLTVGSSNAKDYLIGGTYKFKGYSAGYGSDINKESTLTCSVVDLETVELEPKASFYRPSGENANGHGHRDQVNSVYFGVPNEFFENYGQLRSVKASFYEYKSSFGVVTKNIDLFNVLNSYRGSLFDKKHTNMRYCLLTNRIASMGGTPGEYNPPWSVDYAFNDFSDWASGNNYFNPTNGRINQIPFVYKSDNPDKYIRHPEEFLNDIYTYNLSYNYGKLDKFGYSKDLFQGKLENDRKEGYNEILVNSDSKFNLLNLPIQSAWEQFWGKPRPTDSQIPNLSPVVELNSLNDIDSALIDDLIRNNVKQYYNDAKLQNKRTILLHFAVTDYYSAAAELLVNETYEKWPNSESAFINGETYIFNQSIFLDFDIIYLEFFKAGEYKVIPAVSSPIDIVGSVAPPLKPVSDFWKALLKSLGLVLAVVLVAIIITLLILFRKVIFAPFKSIKRAVSGKEKDKNVTTVTVKTINSKRTKQIKADKQSIELAKQRFKKE